MKKLPIIILAMAVLFIAACAEQGSGDKGAIDNDTHIKGDHTLYGLACDGTNDSTLVLLPNEGGDPVTYDILNATRNNQIFGSLSIGDWVGLMVNPKNKKEATLVVDLDELKGTWTFQVIPKVKPTATMIAEEAEAAMTDSMKALYMVPREYGFTLKRHYQASPVGRIIKESTLDDDSPVFYPKVTNYTSWHILNGRLYLYKDTVDDNGKRIPQSKVGFDDGTFVYLGTDSMAALFGKKVMQYHRKASAQAANAAAQAAEHKASAADTIKK